MPYTITNADGSTLTTIADGTIDTTSTGLSLPGPNFVGYGQYLNQNLVNLLESFASNTAPFSASQIGQLWFNKSNQTLNVFTNTGYTPVNGILVSSTQPLTGLRVGLIWYNSTTDQLFIYGSDNDFELLGPLYTKQQGISGAIPTIIADANAIGYNHNTVQLQFGNIVIATFSSDLAFTPTPTMAGFPVIYPGITINNSLFSGMVQFYANANAASYIPHDSTIIAIQNNAITSNNALVSYINTQDGLINTAIIANSASTNANIISANNSVIAYVNSQDGLINTAIIANSASTNANIISANNAVVSYINAQISSVTANALSQETEIAAINGNIIAANSAISNMSINVATLQTQVYSNANATAYLPIYSGNISGGNISITSATNTGTMTVFGNATIGNETINGNSTIGGNLTAGNITSSGSVSVGTLLHLAIYSKSALPLADDAGDVIYVTDAIGLHRTGSMCFSGAAGNVWIDVTTGNVVV